VENVTIEGFEYLGRSIRNASEGKFAIDHAHGIVFQ
jgi:hypothetical protein